MRRSMIVVISAAAAILIVASGTASADTVVHPTRIGVERTPGKVEPGTEVELSGHLVAQKRECVRGSIVELIEPGEGTTASILTGRRGGYSFTMTVQETEVYRVRFPGKVLSAIHPNSHVCEGSSARIRVRVG